MSEIALPSTIYDLTPKLLNDLLNRSPKWKKGAFESIDVSVPHGAIDGMSDAVYRIDGQLESGDELSLIAKFRDNGGTPNSVQGSQHEVFFYSELAGVAGVESPESYLAEYDKAEHRMLIVLEHLDRGGQIGTIQTYLGVPEVERIVVALAGMHAKWWNSVELAELKQVRTFEEVKEGGRKRFESGQFSGERFLDHYGSNVHPEIADVYRSPSRWTTAIHNGFSGNRTLCNYDVAAKNLFLPDDPNHPPKFFDWSLLTRGSIGIELAVVLAYCLRIEDHSKFEEILDTYLDAMHDLGAKTLTKDTLLNDFRHGLLVRLAAPIALTSRDHPPAHDLALELLPRITSAVLAADALDLMPLP